MSVLHIGDVVQFNNNHKWCGCFGYIDEIKEMPDDTRYTIAIPFPGNEIAVIYSLISDAEFDYIGHAALLPSKVEEA